MPDSKNNTTNNYGLSAETTALLVGVFKKFPQVEEVKIFGSRAMGTFRAGSDIDLVVLTPVLSHDELLDLQIALEDLELLYEIDCLVYQKITEPALQEHIDLVGKTFYKA